MKNHPSVVRRIVDLASAVGTVVLTTAALLLLRAHLSTSVMALLFLVPVVVSAALWGRLAGVYASVLSFGSFLYFFVPPYYTFRVAHPQDFLVMVVLLGVAMLISSLMARLQANLAEVQAREREAVQLYEISQELTGRNDPPGIARALADRLAALLKAQQVEVEIRQPGEPVTLRAPEGGPNLGLETAHLCVPLVSPRGVLGEIRAWTPSVRPTPAEERLLRTIAGQAALALDRAWLSAAENRAQVLEESDKLKTAILSSVSHELRTPLATIQAAATSLFNPALALEPEARGELQSLLLEETERMVQLVGNLLNMSRLEAGALKLQRQWNALPEIVDSSVRRLQRSAGDRQIEVDVSEDLPLVSVDAVLMEQVLINLVGNSLKYAPAQTAVCVRARVRDQALEVTVSNRGPAIPTEHLEHIFEKFYPNPGRDPGRGTGLGLSICKGIIEAHGGRIWAANLPDGVAFIFTLPLAWQGVLPVLPGEEQEPA